MNKMKTFFEEPSIKKLSIVSEAVTTEEDGSLGGEDGVISDSNIGAD